jgi:hypothetical protein
VPSTIGEIQGRFFVPRLSIVIPAWGSWSELETSLVSVLENRPGACEILVALNRPYADPYDLGDEVRFLELPAKTTLVEAWNESLAACRGSIVHFLACGAIVEDDWARHALACFHDRKVAGVGPAIVDRDCPQRDPSAGLTFSRGGACRPAGTRSQPGELPSAAWHGATSVAAFYRRDALRSAGPVFDVELGEQLAALDLCLRLRQAGRRVVLEPASRVSASGAVRQPQARQLERLFWRHAADRGWLGSVAAHCAVVAGDFCRAFPRPRCLTGLVGRLIGACQHRARDSVRYRLLPLETDTTVERRLDPPHADATAPAAGKKAAARDVVGKGPRAVS